MSGSQWAAQARARAARRSCTTSAFRRGPLGGSLVSVFAGPRDGNQDRRRRFMVSAIVSV
eukprot:5254370-Pyramimonas_sp.AAC.1